MWVDLRLMVAKQWFSNSDCRRSGVSKLRPKDQAGRVQGVLLVVTHRAPTQMVVRVPTGASMSILRTWLTMVKCERGCVVLHVVKTGAEDLAW